MGAVNGFTYGVPQLPSTSYPNYRDNLLLVGSVDAISGKNTGDEPTVQKKLKVRNRKSQPALVGFGANPVDGRTITMAKPKGSARTSAADSLKQLEKLPILSAQTVSQGSGRIATETGTPQQQCDNLS